MPEYTQEQKKHIREVYAKDATDAQFEVFLRECSERNLIPGKHVYFQIRTQSERTSDGEWIKTKKPMYLSSIDAVRLIAQRTGEYQGQAAPVYIYLDPDGTPDVESTVPLPSQENKDIPARPYAVRVSVFRKNFQQPLTATARFEAYAQKKGNGGLTDMWDRRGPEQLAKCSEMLALRQAFPEELSGVYIAEEFVEEPETEEKKVEAPKKSRKKVEAEVQEENVTPSKPSSEDVRNWTKKLRVLGVDMALLKQYVEKKYVVKSALDLTNEQMNQIEELAMKAREKGLDNLTSFLQG